MWQGNSERCDWFFLGRDFTMRTVSTETVQVVYFLVFKSRQIYLQLKTCEIPHSFEEKTMTN